MDRALYAVIMAGGTGTRFWPASRHGRPKQFLPVAGGAALLAATRARLGAQVPDEHVLVVAGEAHADLVRAALPTLPPENLLLEPEGKSTLPCVALAAAEVLRRDPDAPQALLPADHVIAPEDAFLDSLAAATVVAAETGSLVTLGLQPTFPSTAYGYIEVGAARAPRGRWPVHDVVSFHEKPDEATAARFLAGGRHRWNAGMFIWTTGAIVAALEQYAPETWAALRDARGADLTAAYARLEPAAVDVGIMERAANRAVLLVDYTWSDVGSWGALAEVAPADAAGNHLVGGGDLLTVDAAGNIVWADPGTLTALIGVEGLVVVRAGDALLVCPRERAEEVKGLVQRLPEEWR